MSVLRVWNLETPLLASGILGYTAESLQRVVEGGAGAVVTKSVGVTPRMGYANPTVVQANCGLINAMGLPNPGIDEYGEEIIHAKTVVKASLIVSVFGYSADEYALIAQKAAEATAKLVNVTLERVTIAFSGSFCYSCGVLDYFEDFIYEFKTLTDSVELKIEKTRQTSRRSFEVRYKIKSKIIR
jgi:hypothetical protein